VGARMGCSVRASERCQAALPWVLRGAGGGFLGVMELLGVGGGAGRGGEEEEKEREACEEREMMACLATAQTACQEHAQQQCSAAFSQALLARSLSAIPLPLLDRRAQRALLRSALHRRHAAAAAAGRKGSAEAVGGARAGVGGVEGPWQMAAGGAEGGSSNGGVLGGSTAHGRVTHPEGEGEVSGLLGAWERAARAVKSRVEMAARGAGASS
ncbi:unnamed protein product, partial [Closterium sp. NIES-53]